MAIPCTMNHDAGRAGRSGSYLPDRRGADRERCCEPCEPHRAPTARCLTMDDEEELSPSVTLDLRGIRVRLEEQDGDLIMLVDDGDVQIEFSSGLNGSWDQAVT